MFENKNNDKGPFLWKKFVNGDDEAFSLLYHNYIEEMFAYGSCFLSDSELVKDFIQDIFVNIYNRKNVIKAEHPKFYLLKALKNQIINYYRDQKEFSPIKDNFNFICNESSVEDNFIKNEKEKLLSKHISVLLNQLTKRQKEAIYLKYIEEMPNKEIAIIMQMNQQSVQNLIQRSLSKLRNTIDINNYI